MQAKNNKHIYRLYLLISLALVLQFFSPFLAPNVHAAALQEAMVRSDKIAISTATTGRVCANPATTATEASVQVVFPAGWTLGAFGTFTVDTTNLDPGTTAWPSIATATNVTSQTVTFPSGDLTVGTLYCFNWNSTTAVTTPSSAGADQIFTVTTRTSTPTNIDSSNTALAIVAADTFTITGTVPQTFNFSMTTTGDTFPTSFSTSSLVTSTGKNVTVATNGAKGWSLWFKDSSSTGLHSATTSQDIAKLGSYDGTNVAEGTCSNFATSNTNQYAYDATIITDSATAGTGTVTLAGEYNCSGTQGGFPDSTAMRRFASANGKTDGDTVELQARVLINALTAAGNDYTDNITVVGAGRF